MQQRPGWKRRSFLNWSYVGSERRRSNRRWALALVLAIPGFFLCERYVLSTGRVTDVSMLPGLSEGQYFLIQKWVYQIRPPRRGEIVVFRPPRKDRWRYVKRVIAVEGDSVLIRSGRVLVNEKPLQEPYAKGLTHPDLGPVIVLRDSCFVLGDNRAESEDSRHFGLIPLDRIEGRIGPGA